MDFHIKSRPKQSVVGWTKEGLVVCLYWTDDFELVLLKLSPSVARRYSRELTFISPLLREHLADCAGSASKYCPQDTELNEQLIIHAVKNPDIQTIGVSLSWGELSNNKKENLSFVQKTKTYTSAREPIRNKRRLLRSQNPSSQWGA